METVFSYKSNDLNLNNPESQPKVYFTCHPDDFDKCFDSVCNDIFKAINCTIYYTRALSLDITEENSKVVLESMNLFVIPVTLDLLTTPNRALDFDFRFALEKGIPVLPLMMEPGLYDIYARVDKFGGMQYLKPYDSDITAISYDDKLKKYLESTLISEELSNRIKRVFDAYIFLSYRKIDRRYANEFIRKFHSIREFQSIAIWYDEYLIPGSNFRSSINKMISDSKLIALLVTPSILENTSDGKPNFIKRTEYPTAKKMNKPIIPLLMKPTDQEALEDAFVELPKCIDLMDETSFFDCFFNQLSLYLNSSKHNDPEYNYLMGLAYLGGVDVETNIDRGIQYLKDAAEQGVIAAMCKLREYYRLNDVDTMIYWDERIYKSYSEVPESADSLDALFDYAYDNYILGKYDKSLELFQAYHNQYFQSYGKENFKSLSALVFRGQICLKKSRFDEAKECFVKGYDVAKELYGETHIHTIALLNYSAYYYYSIENYQEALVIYEKCLGLLLTIFPETHPRVLKSISDLANTHINIGNYDKALVLSRKCYYARYDLYGEANPDTLKSLSSIAACLYELQQYEEALECYTKCYNLRVKVLGDKNPDTIGSLSSIAACLYRLHRNNEALECYIKCHKLSTEVWGDKNSDTLDLLSYIALGYYDMHKYEEALEYYSKCYNLRVEVLGDKDPDTLKSLHSMAVCLYRLHRYDDALAYHVKCYELRCKVLGEDDPDALESLYCLANTYYYVGRFVEALECHYECYKKRKAVLNVDHPDVKNSFDNLFACFRKINNIAYDALNNKDFDTALFLSKKCYDIEVVVLGDQHSETLISLSIITKIMEIDQGNSATEE